MNNYHLYEEIGRGKFSTVYKGRKRHTIRYVAVKSIEKSRRDKVMNEVSILSQLRHTNVLGFINWYETRNHLWIIFEYCAGGDLLHLIEQDGRVPEEQVNTFGRDICSGLLHVHTHCVVYADLKPANILFTEDGSVKLGDFGHSQRLEVIERALQEQGPLPRRGTPAYMAPELLHEGGMHSFASDLWACGCVLYEMFSGRPPFHCRSLQQLQHMVMKDPTPTCGGSEDLQVLLAGLLRKSPLERSDWPQVRLQKFWQGKPPGGDEDSRSLPSQPHVDHLRRMWTSVCGEVSEDTPVSHPSSGDTASRVARSPQDKRLLCQQDKAAIGSPVPDCQLLEGSEPEQQRYPSKGTSIGGNSARAAAAAATAAAGAAAAAAAAAAQQPATTGTPSLAPGGNRIAPSGSLRSRLGAATHARVRDLVTVAETGVRPISRNPQIEEPESLETPSDLPFTVLSLEDICSRPHADLEAFLARVYRCIAQGSLEHRAGALKYLEKICCHMPVADLVVNSSLLRLVLRMLNARRGGGAVSEAPSGGYPSSGNLTVGGAVGSTAPASAQGGSSAAASAPLRARMLSFIGQLLRHATYLEPGIADLRLFDVLLEGLRDQDVALRRRSAAALGELLFYIATQPAPPAGANPKAHKAGDSGLGSEAGGGGWQVPQSALQALGSALSSALEDEVVQHYAVKTVENIATQCPVTAQKWFFSADLLHALARHVRRASWDPFRLSCLAAMSHLLRGVPDSEQTSGSFVEPDLIAIGITDLAPQGVLHGLQLVATAVLSASNFETAAAALPPNAVELLMGVMSQPRYASGLRGRATVLLTLLFTLEDVREARLMRAALDRAFVPHVDRLGREKDRFVAQCVAAAAIVMDAVAVMILQGLAEGLRQLAAADASLAAELTHSLAQVLPVFLHLVSSTTLSNCVLSSRTLPLLGTICDLTVRTPQGTPTNQGAAAQLQPLILMVMEALAAQQGLLLEHAPQVIRCILPALAAMLPSSRSDVRLLALKAFSGACITIVNDDHIFNPTADKQDENTLWLQGFLYGRVLPSLQLLLSDEMPAPSYALRLLATILSRGCAAADKAVRELGLARHLLAALRGQQVLTLHAALLTHCLLRGHGVQARDLEEAGVLDAVFLALSDAAEAAGQTVQMDFSMVDAALSVAEEALTQTAATILRAGASGSTAGREVAAELGALARSLPLLALLCAPLAHARLAPLLGRATTCCQHLSDLARCCGPDRRQLMAELPPKGASALVEALAEVARWHPLGSQEIAAAAALQRKLIAVLGCSVGAGATAETRAEVSAGVERLLHDRLVGDDPGVVADARGLIAAAAGRGAG